MDLKKIIRKRQQLLIIMITVLSIFLFIFVVYLPLRKSELEAEEVAMLQCASRLRTNVEARKLPQLKEELRQLEMDVASYEARVPSSTQLGVFLQEMADVMNVCNLKGHLIEPGKEITTGRLNCIPVNIKCTGKLRQIFDFFKSIENFDRAIRIESVQLSNDSDLTGEVKMQTKLYIYCKPEKDRMI